MGLEAGKSNIQIQEGWERAEGPSLNPQRIPFPCAYKEEVASKALRPLRKGILSSASRELHVQDLKCLREALDPMTANIE